ncbi:MAG: SDR family oxidoreductase [Verrucomicrobia bacterium]|nr:SDR family oxidoreductase [Verrucomicrobiota bacterium]
MADVKRCLITGASRGIGRAIALRLAAPEVQLLLHGRDTVALAQTCQLLAGCELKPIRLVHDLATMRGVDNMIAQAGHEPLDLLINNAGIAVVKPFAEITREEWIQTMGVNVTAPFFLIQHFAPRMRPGASIVNILSIAAKNAYADWSIYCASKFALDGLSAAIREELRPHGVRTLNIYPAATDTSIWSSVSGEWPRERMMSADDVAEAVAYAVSQPAAVALENITLTNASGSL